MVILVARLVTSWLSKMAEVNDVTYCESPGWTRRGEDQETDDGPINGLRRESSGGHPPGTQPGL